MAPPMVETARRPAVGGPSRPAAADPEVPEKSFDAAVIGNIEAAHRPHPRAGRQVDLASCADAGRAGRRTDAYHRPARGRGRAADGRRRCARSAPRSCATARGTWRVDGVGIGGLVEPGDVIDLGNSGTGARLLMGIIAGHPITAFFTGDASLRRRPMARAAEPLQRIGARITAREGCRLPLAITGAAEPLPFTYHLPVPSAQVKSAVLFAGLGAPGATSVVETLPTRDHSERMLRHFGAVVDVAETENGGRIITLTGQPELVRIRPHRAGRPVLGSLPGGGGAAAARLGDHDRRRRGQSAAHRPLRHAARDGRRRSSTATRATAAASRSPISSSAPAISTASRCRAERAPRMIDEYPILAVAAVFATGRTVMRGLGELGSRRATASARSRAASAACGVSVAIEGDDLIVEGQGGAGGGKPRGGATIATHLDHRPAMSFLVFGMAAQQPVAIDDGSPIDTSFPEFVEPDERARRRHHAGRRQTMIVAIDGPAASGKGTLARRLAAHFDFAFLDTGLLYRATALHLMVAGRKPDEGGCSRNRGKMRSRRRSRRCAAARRGHRPARLHRRRHPGRTRALCCGFSGISQHRRRMVNRAPCSMAGTSARWSVRTPR